MKYLFLLLLSVACASTIKPLYPVKMINQSSEPWINRDIRTLNWVIKNDRCKIMTSGRSPIVKKFIKRGVRNFWVICGTNSSKKELQFKLLIRTK